MGRAIPTGSSVLVAEKSLPRRGQVWAYCEQSGDVVVHRYRRRTDRGHVLQGDTRARTDAPVPDEQLIGRVTAVRLGGRVRSVGWSDRWYGECQRVARALVARASRMTEMLPPFGEITRNNSMTNSSNGEKGALPATSKLPLMVF